MSNIPSYILSFLDQFTQPGFIAQTPGLRLMSAYRRKLVALNDTWPLPTMAQNLVFSQVLQLPKERMTEGQLDKLATSIKPEISADLSDEDIELLATKMVAAFESAREAFDASGFYDPTSAAIGLMAQFSIKF